MNDAFTIAYGACQAHDLPEDIPGRFVSGLEWQQSNARNAQRRLHYVTRDCADVPRLSRRHRTCACEEVCD
jgi:hypothetical protein